MARPGFWIYEGSFKDSRFYGKGELSNSDGSKYTGEFKNGLYNGQGIISYVDAIYDGGWKDGLYHGQGTFTVDNVATYTGAWKKGKKDGEGIMTFADGGKHVGTWKNGRLIGKVVITCPNEKILEGEHKYEEGGPTLTLSDDLLSLSIRYSKILLVSFILMILELSRTGSIKGSIFSEVTRLAIYLLFEVFIYYVYLILVLSNYIQFGFDCFCNIRMLTDTCRVS